MMAEAATDWIEWAGGECPVGPETIVDIRFRFGLIRQSAIAGDYADPDLGLNYWIHDGDTHDIIAYRVVSTVAPNADDQMRILRAALQDIADAEAIPNDAEAFAWCRDVARDALAKVTAA